MKETALVVPSIRKDSFERFVREWEPTGLFQEVDLILMEDNPEKAFDSWPAGCAGAHLCWSDVDAHDWGWIVPRRSDTVRSFAYWWAYDQGYQYLMTLDDDCYPEPGYEALAQIHRGMLTRTKWFNTLNSVRPRGTPYGNLGERPVYVNHGLWTGVLDYDAPQQLVNPVPEHFTHDNRIVPHGAYFSFCGMNCCWRREAIVLSYHLLMGKMNMGGPDLEALPLDRFGDIWSGILMKRVCDHLRWPVSTGTPYIHHDRASDPFTNLRKEAAGIGLNEAFWEFVDGVKLTARTAQGCYLQLARAMPECPAGGPEFKWYWDRLGEAMEVWASLFTER